MSLSSIEIFTTHEWFPTKPIVYFRCQGENKTYLPDVKKNDILYTFNGDESWQVCGKMRLFSFMFYFCFLRIFGQYFKFHLQYLMFWFQFIMVVEVEVDQIIFSKKLCQCHMCIFYACLSMYTCVLNLY